MRNLVFALVSLAVAAAVFLALRMVNNDYYFVAGYTVVQYIILATAWNILGGYTGYVNFGSAGFFAVGTYSSVALITFANEIDELVPESVAPLFHSIFPLPIPVLIVIAGLVSGLIGFGTGYLTLRLRGAFFAIATLALSVVLMTLVVNWEFVGGSSGAYVIRPADVPLIGNYVHYLFILMLLMAVGAVTISRAIERSKLGYGFAAIRDDELAAEASGVPTLRLKLIATALSGGLMGMAGAPFPYFIGFVEPVSAFGLEYAVNSIAMPMIGGTMSWAGPLIGAILLGTLQQVANVTISSAVNLLIVGLLLIGFVIVAPNGFVGLVREFLRAAAPSGPDRRASAVAAIAVYCFVSGIFGIVLNLPALQVSDAVFRTAGIVGLALALINLAAAYGLLKLQTWSLRLAMLAFAVWLPFSAYYLFFTDPTAATIIFRIATMAIAVAALCFLQTRHIRLLYRTRSNEGYVSP